MNKLKLNYRFKSYQEQEEDGIYKISWSRFSEAWKIRGPKLYWGLLFLLFLGTLLSIYGIWVEGYYGLFLLLLPLWFCKYILLDALSHRLEIKQTDQHFSLIEYRFWQIGLRKLRQQKSIDFFIVSEAGDLEYSKDGSYFKLYEHQARALKKKEISHQLYLDVDPNLLVTIVDKLNDKWSVDSSGLRIRKIHGLGLWYEYQDRDKSLGLEHYLIESESFEDTQIFKLARRPQPKQERESWAMVLFFLLFGGLIVYGGLATQDEVIFWRILFVVIGFSITGISILLLAYMFSKTVIIQDKNTLSVKKQYLGGLIQFVKSYSRQEYSRFETTGSYDLVVVKDELEEETMLLKQQEEEGYSYQPASVELLVHELNMFWES